MDAAPIPSDPSEDALHDRGTALRPPPGRPGPYAAPPAVPHAHPAPTYPPPGAYPPPPPPGGRRSRRGLWIGLGAGVLALALCLGAGSLVALKSYLDEQGPHTLLIVDASLRAEAQRYAPLAEQAAEEDLAAWRAGGVTGKTPSGFVLSLVKGRTELGSLYRTTKETPIESGVAIPVPPEGVLSGDENSPVVGATRVVIDVRDKYQFTSGTRERQLELFRHEIGHAVVGNLSARAPGSYLLGEREKWVVEGFAEYLGHGRKPWLTSERTANGRVVIRKIGYPTALPGSQDFEMAGRGDFYYWLGHSAIGFMVERYGEQKMFQFVAEHYRRQEDRRGDAGHPRGVVRGVREGVARVPQGRGALTVRGRTGDKRSSGPAGGQRSAISARTPAASAPARPEVRRPGRAGGSRRPAPRSGSPAGPAPCRPP